MDAEPRARIPIPYGIGRSNRNSWLKSLAKHSILLCGMLVLSGCTTLNKPLLETEQDERIRSWTLPTPNPWFWNDQTP